MKRLVILDLDHTLIQSLSTKSDVREAFTIHFLNRKEKYYVHKRNYLTQFIMGLKKMIKSYPQKFKVAIWTAAQRDYAIKIMDNIWPNWRNDILFIRSYSHCSTIAGNIVKDMKRLPQGYDTLLVDDNPLHYTVNTANSFSVWKITPFHYKSLDSELLDVLSYIKSVVNSDTRFSIRPKTPNRLPHKKNI